MLNTLGPASAAQGAAQGRRGAAGEGRAAARSQARAEGRAEAATTAAKRAEARPPRRGRREAGRRSRPRRSDERRRAPGRRLAVARSLFAAAMGWLEAVVVVYIRALLGVAHGERRPRAGRDHCARCAALPWLLGDRAGPRGRDHRHARDGRLARGAALPPPPGRVPRRLRRLGHRLLRRALRPAALAAEPRDAWTCSSSSRRTLVVPAGLGAGRDLVRDDRGRDPDDAGWTPAESPPRPRFGCPSGTSSGSRPAPTGASRREARVLADPGLVVCGVSRRCYWSTISRRVVWNRSVVKRTR